MSDDQRSVTGFPTTASAAAAPLAKPRFMLEAGSLAAIDVGSATHRVLEHLEFRWPCDAADLAAQLSDLVERKLVAPAEADAVDLASLAWLCASPTGELLRSHAGGLRRELPIYLAERELESADPLDQVMRRGRIDVLIPLADGSIVIDYKTDRVAAADIPARAEAYAAQAAGYRRAVEVITGRSVSQVLLVFLHARVVHTV